MKTTVLRSASLRTIALVDILPTGIHVIRDRAGKTLGTYEPKTNRTKDRFGRTVGRGFLLPLLLGDDVLEGEEADDVLIDEMIEPTKPTTPKQRTADHTKRNEIQRKVNTERDRSADKIAALQAKRP